MLVNMSTTIRQSVTLTKPQADYLRSESKRLGLSVSELLRRIVDEYRRAGSMEGESKL
jgi:Ribbon-helix-helix protein, copG family